MNRYDMEYFRQRLQKEREDTINTIDSEEENGVHSSLQDYYNELSVYDNHPADIASETYEMEMRMNLEDREHKHLLQIDNALDKIDKGTYGICENCGKNIEYQRLDVIPQTEVCLECSKLDMPLSDKMDTRPIEEDVLKTPYSRTFKDNSDFNGFDGEDSYQSVSRFNKTDERHMALDWYDNNMYDENISGKVEDVDDVSNEYYEKQLTDEEK